MTEKHPDIEKIQIYHNYGIFKELSEKYGMATLQIAHLMEDIGLQDEGKVGVEFDLDGYVYKVRLPDIESLISDEEYRLIYLEPENEIYKDSEPGKTKILSKGFTKAEKGILREPLKKLKPPNRRRLTPWLRALRGC